MTEPKEQKNVPWDLEENAILLSGVKKHTDSLGRPRWAKVAGDLPHRTPQEARCRFRRITDAQARRDVGEQFRNKCQVCGQSRRGHVCTGVMGMVADTTTGEVVVACSLPTKVEAHSSTTIQHSKSTQLTTRKRKLPDDHGTKPSAFPRVAEAPQAPTDNVSTAKANKENTHMNHSNQSSLEQRRLMSYNKSGVREPVPVPDLMGPAGVTRAVAAAKMAKAAEVTEVSLSTVQVVAQSRMADPNQESHDSALSVDLKRHTAAWEEDDFAFGWSGLGQDWWWNMTASQEELF